VKSAKTREKKLNQKVMGKKNRPPNTVKALFGKARNPWGRWGQQGQGGRDLAGARRSNRKPPLAVRGYAALKIVSDGKEKGMPWKRRGHQENSRHQHFTKKDTTTTHTTKKQPTPEKKNQTPQTNLELYGSP